MQRALGIGYGRAARLIDFMAEDGIVGQYNGSQAREVLITLADWERMQGLTADDSSAEPRHRQRSECCDQLAATTEYCEARAVGRGIGRSCRGTYLRWMTKSSEDEMDEGEADEEEYKAESA